MAISRIMTNINSLINESLNIFEKLEPFFSERLSEKTFIIKFFQLLKKSIINNVDTILRSLQAVKENTFNKCFTNLVIGGELFTCCYT